MGNLVQITGGGLAGLTLGIGLRQQNVPVVVWEAGRYPRHRVCGEFISGSGQDSLKRLGLLEMIQASGACQAKSAAFFSERASSPARPLPQPALCISRFILDELLAREFQRLGGDLRANERWHGDYGPGIVRASGRRVEPVVEGWRYFGLKVHVEKVRTAADLELHFVPRGYVGLCRLAEGVVNVCGLFRSQTTVPNLSDQWRDWLEGPAHSTLNSRLAQAALDKSSFCSVAGFSLNPRHAAELNECCIGDALTMIPPLTGNGMSMAFESAELATGPLVEFSRGNVTWLQTREQIAQACDAKFTRRLRWAGWLQKVLFCPAARKTLLFLTARSDQLWREMFGRTR